MSGKADGVPALNDKMFYMNEKPMDCRFADGVPARNIKPMDCRFADGLPTRNIIVQHAWKVAGFQALKDV